ncbi:MAG: hypothetical protein M3548_06720 [Actinomycetota bacterium]|nr:hypothetical protein [Actinomycetota bacterium]
MNEPITEATALHRYPELEAMREAGWNFSALGGKDELVSIAATRDHDRYTDTLFIFEGTEVLANRMLSYEYGGGFVWTREGSNLQEIVRELLALPAPDEPGAPSLVICPSSV